MKDDNGEFYQGFKQIEIFLPDGDKIGNAKIADMYIGNFEYAMKYENRRVLLDKMKITENGKAIGEMSYLDVIEELGQPSIYIDSYYMSYDYGDYGLTFSFSYSEEENEFMCVEVAFMTPEDSNFRYLDEANWQGGNTPNKCTLDE